MANYRELIKDELIRCSNDYEHAIRKYVKTDHPLKGIIPFNLYPFQVKTLEQLQKHRFNIILKSRQMGISTLVAAYALLNMLFKNNYKVLVIATTQDVAKNLVHKVRIMYEKLPSWLKTIVVDDNKLQLSFKNGSSIKAVASSPNAGRSEALSLLIVDEAAFIESFEDIWTSTQMTLATGGDAIVLSTPNGVDNLFHKLWVQAEDGEIEEGLDAFNPIRLKWDLHPERDQTWRDQQTAILGARKAAQECDCDFLTSGHTVIEGEILQWYLNNLIDEPIEKRGIDGGYWIWKYPEVNHTYVVAADVARGDGGDDSAIQIIDITTSEQVAEYIGQVPPRDLGRMAMVMATEYNNALLAIENKNVGFDAVQVCLDEGYSNLHYTFRGDVYVDIAKHIAKNYDLKSKKDMVPGFTTTPANRPLIINKLERTFEQKELKIYSKRLYNQLLTFVWLHGKAQARLGRKDDGVMALGIGLFIKDTALKLKQIGMEITEKALSHIQKKSYHPSNFNNNDYWTMRDPRGRIISTKWLL